MAINIRAGKTEKNGEMVAGRAGMVAGKAGMAAGRAGMAARRAGMAAGKNDIMAIFP